MAAGNSSWQIIIFFPHLYLVGVIVWLCRSYYRKHHKAKQRVLQRHSVEIEVQDGGYSVVE